VGTDLADGRRGPARLGRVQRVAGVVGGLARTEGQTIGIGVLASQIFAARGGCWWPIEVTPAWLQALSLFLPSGWAMAAMHRLVSLGDGAGAPSDFAALVASAGALAWIGARVFRYQ
jgi:ABC-type multidrug transport system permease subunit